MENTMQTLTYCTVHKKALCQCGRCSRCAKCSCAKAARDKNKHRAEDWEQRRQSKRPRVEVDYEEDPIELTGPIMEADPIERSSTFYAAKEAREAQHEVYDFLFDFCYLFIYFIVHDSW